MLKDNRKIAIIGSRAARYWFPDFREPQDWDYLWEGPTQRLKLDGGVIEEYHNVDELQGNRIVYDRTVASGVDFAAPELLYTLKLSHIFFVPVHTDKTLHDLKFFQMKGVKHDEELYQILYKDFEAFHGRRKAMLKKGNEEFFQDKVKRKYVHDDLHRAVAYYDEPMFEKIKPDRSQAYCSEKMFDNLSFSDKIKLCREEIAVVALERVMIPKDFRCSRLGAWNQAVKQLLTSMTKGWFPKFIAMNWLVLSKLDNEHDFVKLFKEKLECRH